MPARTVAEPAWAAARNAITHISRVSCIIVTTSDARRTIGTAGAAALSGDLYQSTALWDGVVRQGGSCISQITSVSFRRDRVPGRFAGAMGAGGVRGRHDRAGVEVEVKSSHAVFMSQPDRAHRDQAESRVQWLAGLLEGGLLRPTPRVPLASALVDGHRICIIASGRTIFVLEPPGARVLAGCTPHWRRTRRLPASPGRTKDEEDAVEDATDREAGREL